MTVVIIIIVTVCPTLGMHKEIRTSEHSPCWSYKEIINVKKLLHSHFFKTETFLPMDERGLAPTTYQAKKSQNVVIFTRLLSNITKSATIVWETKFSSQLTTM